ncbi:protein kinase domain-containing protein [Sorangium sp. So ce1389]|uniref:serine/threonine-protein kinase n=1 Tax=Sorangium sp. So ce1389 TaxID=3133336 RepID=UPI003F638A43
MPERPPEPPLTADEAAKQRAASYLGRVISKRYRIDEVIAMGGMGAVYRGEHVHMHKRVAIKILHPDTERLPELVQRFEREAIAGAHIQHRNVATATDFGEAEDGSFFLVLEYVRGTTLHEIIRRGAMPVARAALIARQLAAALDATHAMNIVHRDLKPRNVMVVEPQGDLVKLIDFGLAKVSVDQLRRSTAAPESVRMGLEPESRPVRLTTAGVIFGTIAYLAPESALGMDFVDERADLYALGLIFYEMLAGKHPFLAKDPVELFNQQRSAPVPAIAEHSPGVAVPPAVEAVVQRLLEKQPRARFETAAELMAALDQACAASGIVTQEPRAEMSSRAEMTSVPAIADAARVPSNRPPLPSAASREPEASPGSASAIVLGDSCLVSLTEVADALEPAAERTAGEAAGGGAGAAEAESARAAGEPMEGGAGDLELAAVREDAAEAEAGGPPSYSRPTPVRNTPTLVAELTRDSRPTAVGGAAFMAQVAFAREEAASSGALAGADDETLSSDSRPTAVGGAAFMAQVAFAREEAASRGVSPGAAEPPSLQELPQPPRSQEQPASQEPALQEAAPRSSRPPSLEAPPLRPTEPSRSMEELAAKEPAGPTSTRLPLEERPPSPEELERRPAAPSSKKPSLPGAEEPSPAPAAAEAPPARPSAPAAAEPASARSSAPAAAEPASARPSAPATVEPASARPSAPATVEPASARPSASIAAEPASARRSAPSAAEPASAPPPSPTAAAPASSQPPAPAAAPPTSSQPPSLAAATPASSQRPSPSASPPATSQPPSPAAAAPASSQRPPPSATPASSQPPSPAAAAPASSQRPPPSATPASSQPPAPTTAEPASARTPAPSVQAQPAQEGSPSASPASPQADEPPAEDAEPASEPSSGRLSGSRPAFAPTLLRELEAAEAERVAREREEEAKRKAAEAAARVAREREEKARRKLAAREARAARPRQADLGARLRQIAPYLGGGLIAAAVIAALASGGRAPPEPEPQLGLTQPPASALATNEPAPTDTTAAPGASGPAAPAPEAAPAGSDAPAGPTVTDTPAEPPPDEETRKALTSAARARKWVKAAEALNQLAERDPTALRDRAVAVAARNVAISISKTGEELADKVFDALASRFGTAGLDVLYEIVETRGRSTPATRAAKLLRDPEIAARGTPAVRIAFELRDATCGEKLQFLDRAVSEGDQRTLVVLETAVRPCYTKNRTIDEAIKKLRARLEDG